MSNKTKFFTCITFILFTLTVGRSSLAADKPASSLRIMAVGDIMLGTTYPDDWLPPYEGRFLLSPLRHVLEQADITFGNLEGVLLDEGEPEKKCSNPKRCYVFRTPVHYAKNLRDAGFDVMSLANNHAHDFGERGRDSTEAALDQFGIKHSGREGDIASWTVKGLRVAMMAFAPFKASNDFLSVDNAQEHIRKLAKEHDLVIVSMHSGAEGVTEIRVPFKEEIFHGEKRGDMVDFARRMIDAGADLVLGHGPHVPRAMELYKDRIIAYSLGNFCTYWGINVKDYNGLAPILDVTISREGRFKRGKIHSTRQFRPVGPVPDYFREASNLMSLLTEADFPDGILRINSKGVLYRRKK